MTKDCWPRCWCFTRLIRLVGPSVYVAFPICKLYAIFTHREELPVLPVMECVWCEKVQFSMRNARDWPASLVRVNQTENQPGIRTDCLLSISASLIKTVVSVKRSYMNVVLSVCGHSALIHREQKRSSETETKDHHKEASWNMKLLALWLLVNLTSTSHWFIICPSNSWCCQIIVKVRSNKDQGKQDTAVAVNHLKC